MISSIQESPLYYIARPKSIAIFGASNNYASMGTNILSTILGDGYEGQIHPVHPKEETVQGLKAYADVESLPAGIDMAYIVLPTKIVVQTLEACGKKGIRHAVIVSAGFNEAGEEGKARQKELQDIADRYGIRFTGPNCIGVVNTHIKFNATIMTSGDTPGFIGMASQSGSFITQMFDYLGSRYGQSFSTGFSLGNEANIDIVDCIEYLGACPDTKVIGLYIESIRRGRKFIEVAREVSKTKPIVAFYAGGSETGKRACLSHTGALSGPDRLYDGVFRQSGVTRARSIEEMFDYCYAFGSAPLPKGNQVIIQTHSGGPGAECADACERSGLGLPTLSADTLEKLSPFIPHTGSVNNPIDLTYTKDLNDLFKDIPAILLDEERADGMLAYFLGSPRMMRQPLLAHGVPEEEIENLSGRIIGKQCRLMADSISSSDKTVLGFTFMDRGNILIKGLQDRGVPVLPSPERAARAFGAMVNYTRMKEKIMAG